MRGMYIVSILYMHRQLFLLALLSTHKVNCIKQVDETHDNFFTLRYCFVVVVFFL